MTTIEIFTALKQTIQQIPFDAADAGGEKLFEAVELAANRNLAKQLGELLILKSRACLIVPLNIRRTVPDTTGGLSVLGTKFAEVALIYSDKAFFKPSQVVTFGGEKNLGLFGFDEKIEAALTGKEISPFGGIVLGDSDPMTLTEGEQQDAPGRSAWIVTALIPIGIIGAAVA